MKSRHRDASEWLDAAFAAPLLHQTAQMILRIVEESDDEKIVLRLIGRIESEHVRDLETQVTNETRVVVLDLAEIKLVNHAAIRFLRRSEDSGIELRNCPPYVREWIRLDRRADQDVE